MTSAGAHRPPLHPVPDQLNQRRLSTALRLPLAFHLHSRYHDFQHVVRVEQLRGEPGATTRQREWGQQRHQWHEEYQRQRSCKRASFTRPPKSRNVSQKVQRHDAPVHGLSPGQGHCVGRARRRLWQGMFLGACISTLLILSSAARDCRFHLLEILSTRHHPLQVEAYPQFAIHRYRSRTYLEH